ncbi:prolactin-8A8-like [Peromyscus eremicus]|uniref:prolactin-8A8-like n=1 Tax=Peromyscus eremicus TaxID=42410 RepID=UPI0027DDB070|nr:prolactin-8A8-like [Peromyscus eremicus]
MEIIKQLLMHRTSRTNITAEKDNVSEFEKLEIIKDINASSLSGSCFYFAGTLVLLVVMNLLLWEKAASNPECHTDVWDCWEPLVETFNSAINRAQTIHNLAEQIQQEFFHNEFSSGPFTTILVQLMRSNQTVYRARTHCHANIMNPPVHGTEHINVRTKKYLKMLINYVGAWSSPLFHLAIELSAMPAVPETILSKANEIEKNNKELLDDLRWILTEAYPTAKIMEKFPTWELLPFIKSNNNNDKFLAMFNLSFCLRTGIFHTVNHLKTLKCRITGKDC